MLPSAWRYKRFHISYLLAWTAVGVLVGLVAGRYVACFDTWLWYVLAGTLLLGAVRSRRWTACMVAVVAGGIIGLYRGSEYVEQLALVNGYVGQQVVLRGTISQDPVQKNDTDVWQIQLNQLVVGETHHKGEIYATTTSEHALRRGDGVTIQGKASEGFGNFQVSLYRAELLHIERPDNVFLAIRDAFADAVRSVMPEPEASLGLGFVIGQKSALPNDLVEQLKIVGLTHIVVASGYNLTILVRFARRLLVRRSRYLALVGSVLLVVGFVLVSGFSPSMNRAAIVTGLSLLAWYYGRQFHPMQLIVYVASVSAFLYPVYVWSDLGWFLSFAAFTGILVVAPLLSRLLFSRHTELPATGQMVVETLSAELMTLPIIMVYFGYIPTYALLANILVAPVIPFAMAATFVAGLAGLVTPALAIMALPATIVIAYVVAVVGWLSSLPWSQIVISVSPVIALLWYSLLAVWLFLVWRSRHVDLRASSVVE